MGTPGAKGTLARETLGGAPVFPADAPHPSDEAIRTPRESAGVTLVKGDLRAIARARRISRQRVANIKQDLFFAFVYNAAGVPIAADVLSVLGVLLSPMIAAAAMSLSSVSVVGNAPGCERRTCEDQ